MKKNREGEARRASESYGGRKRSQIHFIEQPEAIVEKARCGLESQSWEEIVVGLTVTTGRCVPEILKTGVLFPNKPYTLLFSAYLEQIDEVVGPFELPTLVEAGLVLEAWQRVRRLLPCTQMDASALCLVYRPQVEACARAHFAELAALEASADGYTSLLRQIYALIAARYYCPNLVDRSWFMDLVQGLERKPSDDRIRAQWCGACRQPCGTYEIGNGAGGCDSRQGIKLELPGYDLLDCLKGRASGEKVSSTAMEAASGEPNRENETWHEYVKHGSDDVLSGSDGTGDRPQDRLPGMSDVEDVEDVKQREAMLSADPVRSLRELERFTMNEHFEEDEFEASDALYDELEALEAKWEDEFVERECEKMRQERHEEQRKKAELGIGGALFTVSRAIHLRIEAVKQREGKLTPDGTIGVLLDAYEWLNRGGSFPRVTPVMQATPVPDEEIGMLEVYFVSQTTYERMKAVDHTGAVVDVLKILAHLLDTYEWLIEGGLAQKMSGRLSMMSQDSPEPLFTGPFSNMTEFCDAVWNGTLFLEQEGVLLTFTSETDFTFTYPDGRLIYKGEAADLRFMARLLFQETVCVSPFDNIDEQGDSDEEESGD